MTGYYLGVDIGATKSQALIADETGKAIGFGQSGPGKREGDDYSRVSRVLHEITDQALKTGCLRKEEIVGAGFGIADYDWPSQRAPHLRAIESLGLKVPLELVNDAVIALLAGVSEGWGLCLVSGTGCNCWGLTREGRVGRVTGAGSRLGEAAGANELIGRCLQAVADAWRLSGPPTRLTRTFIERVGARDEDDLVEGLALKRYQIEPAAAPLVFRIAKEGDEIARNAVEWCGRELARMAMAVVRQLGLEKEHFEVVLAGGMFKQGESLLVPLRNNLCAFAPGARLIRLNVPPVVGGVLLGMQAAGLSKMIVGQVRQALTTNMSKLHKLTD